MRNRWKLVAGTLLLALVLAACGGGDDNQSGDSGSSGTTGTTTATTGTTGTTGSICRERGIVYQLRMFSPAQTLGAIRALASLGCLRPPGRRRFQRPGCIFAMPPS